MTSKLRITSCEQIQEGDFYALPHELRALEKQVAAIKGKRRVLSGHIQEAMEQSSETWHDNAPADALFGEMNILDQRESRLRTAERHLTVVEYPDPEFALVTIGSRVSCVIADDEFIIDVVGNLPVHLTPEENVEMGSISAPMPRALLGAAIGRTVVAEIGDRHIEIDIASLDQLAQRAYFEAQE